MVAREARLLDLTEQRLDLALHAGQLRGEEIVAGDDAACLGGHDSELLAVDHAGGRLLMHAEHLGAPEAPTLT